MRFLIALLAAVLAGAVAAAVVVSQRSAERRNREIARAQARWETEKATLEAEISRRLQATPSEAAAAAAAPRPLSDSTPAHASSSLQRLLALSPGPAGLGPGALRRVVHELELLRDCGPAAVEPIRIFLGEAHDYPCAPRDSRPGRGQDAGSLESALLAPRPPLPPEAPLEWVIPPTLRIGLFGALRTLGDDAAKRVLAETLTRTASGLEVACLSRLLDDVAPGKYRELVVTAARDLLTTPPEEVPTERFFEADAPHLYQLLQRFRDPVFVTAATNQLVTARGGIDRWAMGYLDHTLQERAVPVFSAAWSNPAVTDLPSRIALAGIVLPHAGRIPEAGAVLRELLQSPELPSALRALALQRLAGSAPAGTQDPPQPLTGPEAAARLAWLQGIAVDPLDPALRRAHERALESLRRVSQGGTALSADAFAP